MIRYLIVLTLVICSCEGRKSKADSDRPQNVSRVTPLEAYIDVLIKNTTEERKAEIRSAPAAELTVDHFGVGLALRNGDLNTSDSEAVTYLTRNGIWHRDDLSGIVLLSYARRIRGEDLDVEGQFKKYQDYWAEQDVVAPLDINCPICKQEMDVYYSGHRVIKGQPDRQYFAGECPKQNQFWYYHKEGWTPKNVRRTIHSWQAIAAP